MIKYFLKLNLLLLLFFTGKLYCQQIAFDKEKIIAANKNLTGAQKTYLSCATKSDLKICVSDFVNAAKNPYEKNVVANILYNSDRKTSYRLHKEAYESNQNELGFILEYAIELHRNGEFKQAAELYEKCKKEMSGDCKLFVWLADCYINTGDINKSIENWERANHPKNHIETEEAIHSVYERTDQFWLRDSLRKRVSLGKPGAVYDLIHLDFNWEYNWWNVAKIGDEFYKEDLALMKTMAAKYAEEVKIIDTYIKLKKLNSANQTEEEKLEALMKTISESEPSGGTKSTEKVNDSTKIRKILTQDKLILEGNPIPKHGKICSDIINLCFENAVISEKELLKLRGKEILKTAITKKDPDMFNLFAYLNVSDADSLKRIDSLGWKLFGQERFVLGYLRGIAANMKSDNVILEKAIKQLPASSKIYAFQVALLKKENLPLRDALIELIKKDFKTIDSGSGLPPLFSTGHNSYALKDHFITLKAVSK